MPKRSNAMSEQHADPPAEGRRRVVIEGVYPEIDCGRFPIKRVEGESVVVEADIFTDGHDALSAMLLHRRDGEERWTEVPMQALGNDRWRGSFEVTEPGRCRYTMVAWVDAFKTWRQDLEKRVEAEQDVSVDLLVGAELIEAAAERARSSGVEADAERLSAWAQVLRARQPSGRGRGGGPGKVERALDDGLAALMAAHPDLRHATRYGREVGVVVDRERARFSAWYEFFPRSATPEPDEHATFRDAEAWLPYIAAMGFDVVYLPPVHPIGRTHRKGKNNAPTAEPGEVGSPWAIGAAEGGHKAVHPELGTHEDVRRFVKKAQANGLEVALDIAFQASPDHPYVADHPEWFRRRPDGTIQYAENPPKKYQDIYPFDFESEAWPALWEELKSIVLFWRDQGIRIFRVDNPHTKPFAFWEWLIAGVKEVDPGVIFLAEAFTRPRIMYRLAKVGFTQSYTYFAWRNAKWELEQYFTELTRTEVREYFRPNLWPNTPDILTEYLQTGGRPAFMARLVLAATLGASYGIYGPAFELFENRAREPGSEEYLNAEKYQLRQWDIDRPDSLRDLIARVNRIRQAEPALHGDHTLRFHAIDNDLLIAYSKHAEDLSSVVLTLVNLDPHHTRGGWLELPLEALGLEPDEPYQVRDLLSGASFLWQGPRNYVELNPHVVPAHIFRVGRRVRTERDFEYFM